MPGGQWVVFRPDQIKLATAENVDFAAILVDGLLKGLLLIPPVMSLARLSLKNGVKAGDYGIQGRL
jgi:hypothetical protein